MRIVEFDKGLKFLGVLFKSGTIAPEESAVNKFKQRIHSLLSPREARSLLETLTGLKNTIHGVGQCYCKFDVGRLYLDLDAYIRKKALEYMHHNEFLRQTQHNISKANAFARNPGTKRPALNNFRYLSSTWLSC
jgi:hypothetical protein